MGKVSYIILIILLTAMTVAGAVNLENLKKIDIPRTDLWDPVLSPDGTKIAFVAYDDAHNQQIFVINADGTGEKRLTTDVFKKWGLAWGKDKIAYVSLGKDGLEKIFVMNPDGTDNRQLILDNTRQGRSAEDKPPVWAAPSWSPDGRFLLYTSLDDKQNPKMYIVNADGTGKKLVLEDGFRQWSPSFAPDGKNIVYLSYPETKNIGELFIVDISGTTRKQLTFDEINKNYPVWGPEGTIAYVSYENVSSSNEKIFVISQDGNGKRLLADSDYKQRNPSFSLDGSRFSYAAIDLPGNVKIAIGDTGISPVIPSATPTATSIVTSAITSGISDTTAPEKMPSVEKKPGENGSVLWTMFSILGIVIIILVAILVITDFLKKK